jgi:hypothetical protein
MHFPFSSNPTAIKVLACFLIAIGLGWTFAEIRRFIMEPRDSYLEAEDDRSSNRPISMVFGAAFLLIGSIMGYDVFGHRGLGFSFQSPYVLGDAAEVRTFFIAFGCGAAVWGLFSFASTHLLPPPLFGEQVTEILCRIVRGGLLLILLTASLYALSHSGGDKGIHLFGGLLALIALGEIWTGQSWSYRACEWLWDVPPITCSERPFPYVASNLVSIAIAFLFLIA